MRLYVCMSASTPPKPLTCEVHLIRGHHQRRARGQPGHVHWVEMVRVHIHLHGHSGHNNNNNRGGVDERCELRAYRWACGGMPWGRGGATNDEDALRAARWSLLLRFHSRRIAQHTAHCSTHIVTAQRRWVDAVVAIHHEVVGVDGLDVGSLQEDDDDACDGDDHVTDDSDVAVATTRNFGMSEAEEGGGSWTLPPYVERGIHV